MMKKRRLPWLKGSLRIVCVVCGIGYEITAYTKSSNLLDDITDDGFFYDLILLDIEMPGISGMEIPQKIKGFLPNIRIIFVTSHMEYAIDALNCPFSAMCRKII